MTWVSRCLDICVSFTEYCCKNNFRIFYYYVFVGRPEEQDDSENSTIYITGLTEKANIEEMAEFFKHVGPIRVREAPH